ncbi:hypothetical protein C2R75_07270 [Helicobacter pylori]|nr:hypothetical protein C2R75_07270 [Helicobacter pylori]
MNVFHFACLKRIFLAHFNKKKKKRKPLPSNYALAALLALWLAFQKGLKTLASKILSLKALGTIV